MIPISKPWITDLEKRYALDAIESGWISSIGPYVERFENAFAEKIGVRYALTANSGTAACHLALAGMGFRPGDQVIVPSVTFVATANAVKYCNCDIVVADIDPLSWNIDASKVEELVGPHTVALFLVHLYGNMCDMEAISRVCSRNNLVLVEDACEALGGSFGGKKAGSFGKAAAFSFYGNKTLTTGEGGMFATDDRELYLKAKTMRGQGQTERYYHPIVGHNYRMTNIQAAIGLAQLERMDQILDEKKRVFEAYQKRLKGAFGKRAFIGWPLVHANSSHSYWAVTITVGDANPCSIPMRDRIAEFLDSSDIETRPVFYPIPNLPPYRGTGKSPNGQCLFKRGITLPSYPEMSQGEIDLVCDKVLEMI